MRLQHLHEIRSVVEVVDLTAKRPRFSPDDEPKPQYGPERPPNKTPRQLREELARAQQAQAEKARKIRAKNQKIRRSGVIMLRSFSYLN